MTAILHKQRDARRYQAVAAIDAEIRTALPWMSHPGFQINSNEGFDGTFFGARTGTLESVSTINVLHEASHALDMSLLPEETWKYRVRQPAFDMRILSYQDIGGERYYEPLTLQPTKRECRVGGIQLRLLEAGGFDTSDFVERYVLTLKWMADAAYGGRCPLNTPNRGDYTRDHWKWIAKRTQWVYDAYHQYSVAEIKDRWSDVISWLSLPESSIPERFRSDYLAEY